MLFPPPGRVEGKGKDKLRKARERKRESETERCRERDKEIETDGETDREIGRLIRRDRDRKRRGGNQACARQGLLAGELKGWAGQGEIITRDPGCVHARCQGDLPERKREGSQGWLPAGPERQHPPSSAHCHPPPAQPLASHGSRRPSSEHRGSSCRQRPAFRGQRTCGP